MKSKPPHIVVNLKEQLGNQLFQLAAAKQLEYEGASISFSLRTDRIPGSAALGHERLEQLTGERLTLATVYQELATGYLPRKVYKSPFLDFILSAPIILPTARRILSIPDFDPRPEKLPEWPLYRLQGYFQHRSWYYRTLSSVVSQIEGATREIRSGLPSFDLCVHLRRGAYLSLHRELSFDYYVRALELFVGRAESVIVTSDDELAAQAFCAFLRANGYDPYMPSDVATTPETSSRDRDPVLFDFCLMASAKNIIMSNSTFCWWATVLGDYCKEDLAQRTVVYPRGWFRFQDDTTDKLLEPNWTIV